MRPTILRRLEALERENRASEETKESFLVGARWILWLIVLGHYLGDLKLEAHESFEAIAKVLNYASGREFFDAMFRENSLENDADSIRNRFIDACRRLFAKVGLEFETTPSDVLFDAFVKMVDQLPDYWLQWIRSELEQGDSFTGVPRFYARFAPGANVPYGLTAENYLWWQ